MPNKQAIIDNIEQYSASELVDYIRSGIVTLDELKEETEGYFPANVRKEVESLLANSEQDDWLKAKRDNTKDAYMAFLRSYPGSTHAEDARDAIRALKSAEERTAQQSLWDEVDKSDEQSLRDFISNNPTDPHVREARQIINKIQQEEFLGFDTDALIDRINTIRTDNSVDVDEKDTVIGNEIINYLNKGKITRDDLLSIIKTDHNLLRATVLKRLINEGLLEYGDFLTIGIDSRFVKHLAKGASTASFQSPRKLEKINKMSTEVYFWGIPSSGKSCALGAILSVANNGTIAKSMSKDPDCQGYGYMTRLAQLFKSDGKVGTLPEGTSIYSTYEMGFDLEDENGASHPITCIDLAGELVRCMYKSDAGEEMSDDEVEALDTLTRVLVDNKTVNRKIHFFVLEYGGENRLYEGLSQTEYLDAALQYIERTKIFQTETDAIYLMLTKVDKVGFKGPKLVEVLTQYIEDNYKGFYQGLERLCRLYEINGGKVERIPFSLGQVYFQDFCLFNEAPAGNVVKKLLIRSKGFKNGKLQKGLSIFKR